MKTKNIQRHKTCVLILVLILVLNMLLPMEALAAETPSYPYSVKVYYNDGVMLASVVILGGDTELKTWADVKYFTYMNYGSINDIWIEGSLTSDTSGHVMCSGFDYLSSDGKKGILTTDTVPEEGSTIFSLTSLPLDFTAPESLTMKVTQGHSDLTIDPCVITNTGSEDLKLSQVEITAADGWTVVASSTDFTTADSKNQIAFTSGSHDFANGAYTPNEKITAGSNTTLQLAGKISEKADLTNATQVASMVLTVEKVELISFTIEGISYQAEKGMTWEEWIESDYRKENYVGALEIDGEYVKDTSVIGESLNYKKVLVSDLINNGASYVFDMMYLAEDGVAEVEKDIVM